MPCQPRHTTQLQALGRSAAAQKTEGFPREKLSREVGFWVLQRKTELSLSPPAGNARGEALLSRVESVAEAHSAHAQLFDLCELLADRKRLSLHMSAGEASARDPRSSLLEPISVP